MKEVNKFLSIKETDKKDFLNSKKEKCGDVISPNDIQEINKTIEEINKLKVLIYHQKKMNENKVFEKDLNECLVKIHSEITQIASNENITNEHIDNLRKRIRQINK
jgi:prefoldin subunit 5